MSVLLCQGVSGGHLSRGAGANRKGQCTSMDASLDATYEEGGKEAVENLG